MKDKYLDIASKMRKVAAELSGLRKKRAQEKLEKCAAVVVAKVGLEELKRRLSVIR